MSHYDDSQYHQAVEKSPAPKQSFPEPDVGPMTEPRRVQTGQPVNAAPNNPPPQSAQPPTANFPQTSAPAGRFDIKSLLPLPPTKEVTLPSLGGPYREGSSLENGKVQIRRVVGAEDNMILGITAGNVYDVYGEVLRRCTDGTFDPSELTSEDHFALMLWLRINSYPSGHLYNVPLISPYQKNADGSGKEFEGTIDLSRLNCEFREVPPEEEVTLPESGIRVIREIPRVKHEGKRRQLADRMARFNKGPAIDYSDEARRVITTKKIVFPNGHEVTNRNQIETVYNALYGADRLALDRESDTFKHGYEMKATVTCRFTGESFETGVPLTEELFRPSRDAASRTDPNEETGSR